jgi:small subunit ribosomal protein S18
MSAYKRTRFARRKVCRFCEDKIQFLDYKNTKMLRMYISERGKIIPRRISGNCASHQRTLTTCIKRARQLALVSFTSGR